MEGSSPYQMTARAIDPSLKGAANVCDEKGTDAHHSSRLGYEDTNQKKKYIVG